MLQFEPSGAWASLSVKTEVQVERIIFDEKGLPGKKSIYPKAIGVEYRDLKTNKLFTVNVWANGAVYLAAGAVGTPQLLMLSGVGAAEELNQFSIPLIADNEGVGSWLRDKVCFADARSLFLIFFSPWLVWVYSTSMVRLGIVALVSWLFLWKMPCWTPSLEVTPQPCSPNSQVPFLLHLAE